MIDPNLFAQPQALDRVQHRSLRLKSGATRYDRTAGMNALFITAVEFGDVCREYPIVFVDAGTAADGQREIAPMAVLGLQPGENLMLRHDGAGDDLLARTHEALAVLHAEAHAPTGPGHGG